MTDLLAFDPGELWYIQTAGYGSKFPEDEWGGYNQSFVASDDVYSHDEIVASEHDFWAVCGCRDFDHGRLATLVFDLDIHKAPEAFDADRVTVPEDTLLVQSQNGGLHVYFKVHADRGELQESDFQPAADLPWDIDIRGSAVSMHVVAPTNIPGVNTPYEVVNNADITTVTDPADAAERIQLDGEPLLEYDPGSRAGAGIEIDRDADPPAEMPTCYHRGLQLRAAAPEDHPNTHKVNVLTALCGLAAGYSIDEMQAHFCEEYPPGSDVDAETSRYHLEHIAEHVDRGEYSPPAISTLRDFGILDEGETCECSIAYHGGDDDRLSAAAHAAQQVAGEAEADGGAVAHAGGEGSQPDLSLRERVLREVIEPLERDEEPITNAVARDRMVDILTDEYHFVRPREDTRGWRATLYVYTAEDGIYEPHGEAFLEREIERLVGAWADDTTVREIINKIERRSRISSRRLEAAPERLVVANGILDLTTGEVGAYDPAEYHRTMVDVAYDPDAECPAIDEFFHDVVAEDDVPTLYRLVAHTLYKEYAAEKAAMLLGDGRNGKSVFLSLVEEFVGSWNVANRSLRDLNEDDWAANNLAGKLANVHPDLSDQTINQMQMFKKLTGRDTVSADVKFESPVQFENHATLLFACNRMPVLDDDTRGNWRRWLLLDFPHTFEPDAEETVPKRELMQRLTQESELEGLLARCVEEIQAWDQGRDWFPSAPDWETTRSRVRRAAEPIYDFAHACLRDSSDGWERTERVRACYQAYAKAEGLPGMSREEFGKKLLALDDYAVEKQQKRDGDRRVQAYAGVEFTSRGRQLVDGETVDGEESQQSAFSGPRDRADTIVELTAAHVDECDDGVPGELLVGLAMGEGMSRDEARHALQKAANKGDLYHGDDGYLPT